MRLIAGSPDQRPREGHADSPAANHECERIDGNGARTKPDTGCVVARRTGEIGGGIQMDRVGIHVSAGGMEVVAAASGICIPDAAGSLIVHRSELIEGLAGICRGDGEGVVDAAGALEVAADDRRGGPQFLGKARGLNGLVVGE